MGGIADATRGVAGAAQQATLEARVERLTKLVHILWKEAERLESMVHATQGGLRIKNGFAEVFVKKNGEVVITGQRIELKASGEINIKGQKVRINDNAV